MLIQNSVISLNVESPSSLHVAANGRIFMTEYFRELADVKLG